MSNIWIAASDNKIDKVREYIESGSYTANSKDPNGYTPMHAAASYGNLDLLKYLVSQGGDINIQDSDGDTPLHHVETVEAAKFLIEELKADFKIKNKDGLTPAKYQEEEDEYPELIEYLSSLEKLGTLPAMKTGIGASQSNLELPNGERVKMYLSKDSDENLSDELIQRRKEIESIMNDDLTEEQKDEKLRSIILGVVSGNVHQLKESDGPESKRQR
ncbi:hypothetical protein KL905_002573 [Ogataea polymorpha]|uniref:Uncharacterized protein n=1 Tax=Ogataea polymorpha TaxID=460523 RepID=A0A1B7SPG4_9ASCO|nr:uncharacterized protein OGAPODRAFT_6001 [Ogataea polymorpha]KAG7880599.1 hypothetical protein KL937_002161 [Ogataea polymorpha]KAG7889396.1 hypothetical protein KL936_002970 [Ogataea polymorpha]KAG7894570.1 hypothetical protein KL908_001942 [Ogataea polymorpha]KAG7906677.1 hypothetical protein KL907_002317 [Ogataea polymorpha]KAG7909924.1 hypothetical protein KL906_001829 [Ogataea polymorpha]